MKFTTLLLLAWVTASGYSFDLGDSLGDTADIERPRLADKSQEIRTTSVNWVDLDTERKTASAEAAAPAVLTDVAPPKPLKFRIVIDAGHGGKDLGALGPHGLSEKELCLRIGWLVKRDIERTVKRREIPVEIHLTREGDHFISLRDRVKVANEFGADLFVSIHANASDFPRARGFEVYFLSAEASDAQARKVARAENSASSATAPLKADVQSILSDVQATRHVSESSGFAEFLFRAMAKTLHPNGRGVRQAPFTVLAGTSMPALLIEVGYLTNEYEARLLMRAPYLKRIANAISTGIIEFLIATKKLG